MAGRSMKSITTNMDYYKAGFQLFAKKCRKAELDRAWTQDVFPSATAGKFGSIPPGEAFKSLGIGSGSGEFESFLLQHLKTRYPKIHHTVVEPAAAHIALYKSLIASTEGALDGVTFDWREETMQQFEKSLPRDQRYNFISCVHTMYYADDISKAIQFYHGCLEKSGLFMVTVTSEQSDNTKLYTKFPVITELNPHISLITADHVRKSLRDLGLEYTSHFQRSSADISPIFDEESDEGNVMLDFLTHTIDFRKSAPGTLLDDILNFLKYEACSYSGDGGAVLLRNPWNTFFIYNN